MTETALPRLPGYEPRHASYSMISSYRMCGAKFRFERVMNLEQIPGLAAIGGNAVHTASEVVDAHILEHGFDGLADLDTKAIFAEAWAAELSKRAEQSPSHEVGDYKITGRAPAPYGKRTASWFEDHGHEMVDRWVQWRLDNQRWQMWETPEGTAAIELGIDFTLPGGIPVKTFIDRVMVTGVGEPVVVDLKTGRLPETAEQLGLYRCAVWAKYGIRIDWGYWWDAQKGVHVGPYDLSIYTPEFFAVMYRDAVAGINAESFLPKPANNCANWCGVSQFCHAVGGSKAKGVDPLAG